MFQALNTVTCTYSYSTYCELRTAIIKKNCNIDERFPFPISFDPETFHILSIDNYDQNFPSGDREAFHSLGTMLNIPKPSVKTPLSMAPDIQLPLPSAPPYQSRFPPQNAAIISSIISIFWPIIKCDFDPKRCSKGFKNDL